MCIWPQTTASSTPLPRVSGPAMWEVGKTGVAGGFLDLAFSTRMESSMPWVRGNTVYTVDLMPGEAVFFDPSPEPGDESVVRVDEGQNSGPGLGAGVITVTTTPRRISPPPAR